MREKLAFNGAIFSDDLTMGGAEEAGTVPERTMIALDSGADVALICNNPEAAVATIDALSSDTERYLTALTHPRLAAMRSRRRNQNELVYGSDDWRRARKELEAGLQPPDLTLQG